MLAFGTRGEQRAQELAQAFLAAELPASLAVDLHDLRDLERTGKRYSDVGAWVYDINALNGDKGRDNDEVKADVLRRWRDSQANASANALPWLVAAMMFLGPDDAEAAEAITASEAIDANSPAYYTLAWHRLRLRIEQGKTDEARAELDRLLAAPALPEGVGNLLHYQRLKLARDVGEYAASAVRHGEFIMYLYDPGTNRSAVPLPLRPAKDSYKSDSYIANVVGWRTELFQKDPPYVDADAAYGMSSFMPLPMMAQVVLAAGLPANIKRDLALAVFTRAVLLEDAATAKSMAEVLAPFFPQFADNWKSYRNAADASARKVEAALVLLKLPAARPWPDSGLGYMYKRDVISLYGPRWWAKDEMPFGTPDANGNLVLCEDCGLPLPLTAPPFITDANKAAAQVDNARLSKLPGAPTWLGEIVIAWAKAHLSDPRVPEALHNVVRATQYGDMDSDTSQAAYDLLHGKFPRNAWTSKTPHWF